MVVAGERSIARRQKLWKTLFVSVGMIAMIALSTANVIGLLPTSLALSCVLIDRIPFPPKDDPLISWMEEAAQRDINDPKRDPQKRKPNVFFDYMLPRATIDLRQGVGRLIRAADDRGVVCIFDKRLTDMKYGARIIDALGIGDAMINMADVAAFFASDHRTHDPSGE